jgi:hypothetical protein
MFHPNFPNHAQTDEQSSRENGIFFLSTIQREEVSSLAPAGSARHPPPTSAGLFLPATPTLNATAKPSKGSECTSTFVTLWTKDLHYNSLEV